MIKSRIDKLTFISFILLFAAAALILSSGSIIKAGNLTTNERQALTNNPYNTTHVEKQLPLWAKGLGIQVPEGLTFLPSSSASTSKENPSEGFNSVSLVFQGTYDEASAQAQRIAKLANLPSAIDFKAKGSPLSGKAVSKNPKIRYANYGLETQDQQFLVSIEVEPSGKFTLMVTDNKQLSERLLAYEPMNIRQKNFENRKKQ